MERPASSRLRGLICAFAATVSVVASASPATARAFGDLTATKRASPTEVLDAFLTATAQGQAERVTDVMPPRVLESIAAENGIEPDAMRRAMVGKVEKMHDCGTLYALVPMRVSVKGGSRDVEPDGRTLALAEDGRWYLADISSEKRLQTFQRAYPDFAGVDPGPKTIETKP